MAGWGRGKLEEDGRAAGALAELARRDQDMGDLMGYTRMKFRNSLAVVVQ